MIEFVKVRLSSIFLRNVDKRHTHETKRYELTIRRKNPYTYTNSSESECNNKNCRNSTEFSTHWFIYNGIGKNNKCKTKPRKLRIHHSQGLLDFDFIIST